LTEEAFYFCRHGITEDLVAGIRNRPDTPLTAEGRRQMERAAETLRPLVGRPDEILCSTLRRAVESADVLAVELGYQGSIEQLPALDERYCGAAIGMKNVLIRSTYPGGFDTVPGAESTESLQKRALEVTEWLLARRGGGRVVVVGHGVFGRAVSRGVNGWHWRNDHHETVRRGVNLGNGEIMKVTRTATEVLQ